MGWLTHHEVAQLGVELGEASRGEEDDDLVPPRVRCHVLSQQLAQFLRLVSNTKKKKNASTCIQQREIINVRVEIKAGNRIRSIEREEKRRSSSWEMQTLD